MSTECFESVDPLVDESGRENNESSLEEVGDDQSNNLNGLAKTHFITDESTLADLLCAEQGWLLGKYGMFSSEAPLNTFYLVWFFSRTSIRLAPGIVATYALFEEGVDGVYGCRFVVAMGIFDGGATDRTCGFFVVIVLCFAPRV